MTHLDDDLLTALRGARPSTGDQPSAASPEATATLNRILQAPRAPVRHRSRTRRTRRRLVLAGIPATAGIAAAVLAVTLTSSGTASGPNLTVPSVRIAVLDAFQRDSGDIMYTYETIKLSRGPMQTQPSWTYPAFAVPGQQVRFRQLYLQKGVPTEDTESIYTQDAAATRLSMKTTQGPRSAEIIDVEYGTKTWSRQRSTSVLLGGTLSPALIKSEIASGHFTVAGQGSVQGHHALKLVWGGPAGHTTATLWVDAKTYQPLRGTSVLTLGPRAGLRTLGVITTQFQILPATPANLRLLTPPIPAGFHRVASSPHF